MPCAEVPSDCATVWRQRPAHTCAAGCAASVHIGYWVQTDPPDRIKGSKPGRIRPDRSSLNFHPTAAVGSDQVFRGARFMKRYGMASGDLAQQAFDQFHAFIQRRAVLNDLQPILPGQFVFAFGLYQFDQLQRVDRRVRLELDVGAVRADG